MKLILRRRQKQTGLMFKRWRFYVELKVELSYGEKAAMSRYRMGREILYSKQRIAIDAEDPTALGMVRNLSGFAAAITITANDLVNGKTIKCKDIVEMRAIVAQIEAACRFFKIMLDDAADFQGEQVIEL